jgi:hypothetical protein
VLVIASAAIRKIGSPIHRAPLLDGELGFGPPQRQRQKVARNARKIWIFQIFQGYGFGLQWARDYFSGADRGLLTTAENPLYLVK